jgi:hypothetical protein
MEVESNLQNVVLNKNRTMDNVQNIIIGSPWSRVLLEKLAVAQLVKEFPLFRDCESSLPC